MLPELFSWGCDALNSTVAVVAVGVTEIFSSSAPNNLLKADSTSQSLPSVHDDIDTRPSPISATPKYLLMVFIIYIL